LATWWLHEIEGTLMARPKKSQAPDLNEAHDLTLGLIDRMACPPGKLQSFLRDCKAPGLRVRATPPTAKNPVGVKAFVFEAKLNRQTIRRTIGDVRSWTIEAARIEANRLRVTLDGGLDPREIDRAMEEAASARRAAEAVQLLTVAAVWSVYLAERKPHWGDRHYQDHVIKASPGGEKPKRGTALTVPGPLAPLMPLTLRNLDAATIEAWATAEGRVRPTSARLSWRLLKGFLGWCAEQPAYAGLMPGKNPARTKKAREALGKPGVKSDVLQREQLAVWFAAIRKIQNPAISAYLQTILLTGARPGEVITLQWQDINTQWKGITIRDKVEGERVIPLTPFVAQLVAGLPRRNQWVFSSPTSASGYLSEPTYPHTVACKAAGLDGLTLHGLRRSFKSLTEWLEVPTGIVAQIMGHKPSATAEKHYTVRPLELLRLHHEKIERWVLEQAELTCAAQLFQRA
jgi:integrase